MPDWTHHLRQRLTHLDLDGGREAEIVEELSQHLDERYEELRRHGSSEAEACRVAMDELVDPDSLVEHMRPLRQAQTVELPTPGMPAGSLWSDVGTDLHGSCAVLIPVSTQLLRPSVLRHSPAGSPPRSFH